MFIQQDCDNEISPKSEFAFDKWTKNMARPDNMEPHDQLWNYPNLKLRLSQVGVKHLFVNKIVYI